MTAAWARRRTSPPSSRQRRCALLPGHRHRAPGLPLTALPCSLARAKPAMPDQRRRPTPCPLLLAPCCLLASGALPPFGFMLQEAPGFVSEPEDQGEQPKTVTTGFARNAVLGVAGEVVKAVQEGHLKHIFLIGESQVYQTPFWGLQGKDVKAAQRGWPVLSA